MKKRYIFYIADIFLVYLVFRAIGWAAGINLFKGLFEPRYLTTMYMILWVIGSFLLRKHRVKSNIEKTLNSIGRKNIAIHVSITLLFYYSIEDTVSSYKWVFLVAFVLLTILEMLGLGLFSFNKLLSEYQGIKPKSSNQSQENGFHEDTTLDKGITSSIDMLIIQEIGREEFEFVKKNLDGLSSKTYFLSSVNRFDILKQPDNIYSQVVNLAAVNKAGRINKLFEAINKKLPIGGKFIGFTKTIEFSKKKILDRYPSGINQLVYYAYSIWQNMFPKVYLLREIYFIVTTGKYRELSKAETFGRLYSCGFKIISEDVINGKQFFVVEKIKEPVFDENPTYGPLIKLRRFGKGGKLIKVYKFRSMYPYSEYLQDYVFKQNNLQEGGKFKDDFRVTDSGKFLRKLWLDELPMFINVLKGEMKIVGVRPLSRQYFNLYTKELQEKRIQHKPGLIPPFYVDMPKTLEEIMASELKYLNEYEKYGFITDWKYFWKALYNILIKKARSQ